MPKIEIKREDSVDAEDRRMFEEIRDMSLREAGVRGPGSYERGHRHRHRDGSRDTRDEEARHRRREQDRRRRQEELGTTNGGTIRSGRSADSRAQARHLEHQSSLRSLLNDSGVGSAEMQTEILRQIQEEGLLDGVDLDDLDVSQEDELSERIADAYRRRHSQGLRTRDPRTERSRESSTPAQRIGRERSQHRQPLVPSSSQQTAHSSHPPVSRPHLFDAYPTSRSHRHRTSSEHRRQTSPATAASLASSEMQRRAARSATDLSDRPRTRTNVRDRTVEHSRRTTDPERQCPVDTARGGTSHMMQISGSASANVQPPLASPRTVGSSVQTTMPQYAPPPDASRGQPNPASPLPVTDSGQTPYPLGDLVPQETIPAPATSTLQSTLYPEPSRSCDRCGKASIEYDLHFHCSLCCEGNYNICLRCYRGGKGCLHWFGFGKAAMQRYERLVRSPGDPLPHSLTGNRYLRPPPETQQPPTTTDIQLTTTSDPSTRLQSGFFCSTCSTFANDCFWKCDRCNDGEWGFCNPCVNQGKCCTHSLLPIAHPSIKPQMKGVHRTPAGHSFTAFSTLPSDRADRVAGGGREGYTPLTFSTACDVCTYPIPPSTTRFHCPQCNDGDYDICKSCYLKLITSGRISPENGTIGWRKCLRNHRMIIVGFEDGPTGQRRVVVKDLVGGHARKDTTTATTTTNSPNTSTSAFPSNIPVSGGTGLKATALWAYWPNEGVEDELGFPKGAEITEARDINGDWWEGWYCGRGGLWPEGYARVMR